MLDTKYVPCHFKGTEFPPKSQCFKKRQSPSMPFNIFLYDFDGLNIKYYRTLTEQREVVCFFQPFCLPIYTFHLVTTECIVMSFYTVESRR